MDWTDYVNGGATFNELHDYTHDTLNRRDRDDLLGGVFWDYEYNERNEVISGSKRLTNGNQIPGWQWAYLYDSVGNRISAASGGDINGANRRITGYPAPSTNSLNQYTRIGNPDTFDVTGTAIDSPGVTVSVNQAPLTPGDRLGNFFRKELNGDNASGPAYVEVEIEGRALGLGVNGQDVVTRRTGRHYIPPANETLSYDLDGNLQEDGRWNYVWDGENRLKEMTTTAAAVTAGVPERKLEFLYDGQGRRIQKKVYAGDGDPGSPGPWTMPESDERFLYDGWNLIAILDENNNLLKSFVWGLDLSGTAEGAGGVGGLLMIFDHSSPVVQSYFPAYDGNGNVMALIHAEDADVEAQFEYSPFGEVARAEGPAIGLSPFGFSTKYADSETGLAYYGFRYYDPRTGRWLSRDPIGEEGGLNLYGFVGNDPVNRWDYLGLEWLVPLRDGKEKIWACPQSPQDTWKKLGDLVGLSGSQAKDWVTDYDATPKVGKRYKIPNTIYALWLGGFLDSVATNFNSQVADLRKEGFNVIESQGSGAWPGNGGITPRGFLWRLGDLISNKKLHGLLVDGHGNAAAFYTGDRSTFRVDYIDVKDSLKYLLGAVILNTCNGGWCAKDKPTPVYPGDVPIGDRFDAWWWYQAYGPYFERGQEFTILAGGRDLISDSQNRVFYGLRTGLNPVNQNARIPRLFKGNKQRTR